MISRRSIRVKVMQSLYSLSTLENEEKGDKILAKRLLNTKLVQVFDTFTLCVLYLTEVAKYAETDAQMRSARYLKKDEDKNVNISIATNSFINNISESPSFKAKLKKDKIKERFIQMDWVKKLYNQLIKTDEYIHYIESATHTPASEKEIIQYIWQHLFFENPELQEYFIDELPGWEDDKEVIGMVMDNLFKKNAKVDFMNLLSAEKREYAEELIYAVIDKEAYTMELIEQKLNNWDKERIALIDQILLRMGVCELLYFPTIPTKVTINEYIDIAKQYSTPLSGQFVNGVLDNILKELQKENKINKRDRN